MSGFTPVLWLVKVSTDRSDITVVLCHLVEHGFELWHALWKEGPLVGMAMETIETDRLLLRPLSIDDFEAHYAIVGSNPKVTWGIQSSRASKPTLP